MKEPIVTVSLLRYAGWRHRWWAFTQMGLGTGRLAGVPGLRFVKLLGSGGGNGFGLWPNFGVYAFLGSWTDEAAARHFFANHPFWQSVLRHSSEQLTAYLQTAMAHGRWDGQEPFTATAEYDPSAPVAVLTRATLRPTKAARFWRYVPRVSAAIERQPDRLLSIGVGEYPLFMQATFSLWRSGKSMQAYAYGGADHREMIRKTRELGWYREELFARFTVKELSGTWRGPSPSLPTTLVQPGYPDGKPT